MIKEKKMTPDAILVTDRKAGKNQAIVNQIEPGEYHIRLTMDEGAPRFIGLSSGIISGGWCTYVNEGNAQQFSVLLDDGDETKRIIQAKGGGYDGYYLSYRFLTGAMGVYKEYDDAVFWELQGTALYNPATGYTVSENPDEEEFVYVSLTYPRWNVELVPIG